MARLTKQQWRSLIADYESSGLTQADFCLGHNLNPKYFSLKRKLIAKNEENGQVFSKVVIDQPILDVSKIAITLQVGVSTVNISGTLPPAYLTHVIQALI